MSFAAFLDGTGSELGCPLGQFFFHQLPKGTEPARYLHTCSGLNPSSPATYIPA